MPTAPDIDLGQLVPRLDALTGIEQVRAAAAHAGLDAYLVGGSVRDLLLGRDRVDIDVAIEGDPLSVANELGGETRSHERFRTATVRVDEHAVDLAATRSETYSRPGALPE